MVESVVAENDSWCRGVVLLGLDAPEESLKASFAAAASAPIVKGFAIGRTIFADPARTWLAGRISDEQAVDQMTERFRRLARMWESARA